jgi:prepilin-type N-terminal cleavage/methylation domain-containing protein
MPRLSRLRLRSRRRLRHPASEAGFSLIEVLVSIMVLAIVAGGLAAGLTATSSMLGRSKADSIADKLASSEIEMVRRMSYDNIGTVGGNPPGALVADRNVTRDGATFRVQNRVVYVDNAAPGASQTRIDYKSVQVIVTPAAAGSKSITQTTLVAPPTYASIAGKSAITVSTTDKITGAAIAGSSITVTGGPSPTVTEVTDATGNAVIAGLTPNSSTSQKYTAAISRAGYVVTNPAGDLTNNLVAAETFPIAALLVKPVRLEISLLQGVTAVPITETATVTITPPGGTPTALGGTGVFGWDNLIPNASTDYTISVATACAGFVSSTVRLNPTGYPTTTTQAKPINGFTRGNIVVTVQRNSNSTAIAGATVTITGGNAGLTGTQAVGTTDATGKVTLCVPATSTVDYTVRAAATGFTAKTVTTKPLANGGTTNLAAIKLS